MLNKYPKDSDQQHSPNPMNGCNQGSPSPYILPRSSHNLSRELIDQDVLKVLYRLKSKGFIAYLVGGCVRDILLKRTPKDFYVCTDATPSQLRRMFRNCRLIGRRFRLAHIIFRYNKIVEVSTFRRAPDGLPETEDRRELTIQSNRYYGSPAEDAYRRDFTINALFYNIRDFSIIDYVGGVDDLQKGVIRGIGDPYVRFYEDPVRMMRGIEFASRLDFRLDSRTFEAIKRCRDEIKHGSCERIKEELMAILMSGYSHRCFSLFFETGLFFSLFPEFHPWKETQVQCLLFLLQQVDNAILEHRPCSEYLSLATFLWPFIAGKLEDEEIRHLNDLDIRLRELINPFCYHFNIRIHYRHLIKEIYRTIWRMNRGTGYKGEARMVRKDFFKDALSLFRWLGAGNMIDPALITRWDARLEELNRIFRKSHKRRRKHRKKSRHKAHLKFKDHQQVHSFQK